MMPMTYHDFKEYLEKAFDEGYLSYSEFQSYSDAVFLGYYDIKRAVKEIEEEKESMDLAQKLEDKRGENEI